MPVPDDTTHRPTESVRRALQLLGLFVNADPAAGVTVTAAARTLGVGKSTVSRLLATMASSGLLIADADRRYCVSPLAFEIGNRFVGASIARAVAPVVRDLAEQTGATAQLGTLSSHHVLYLCVHEGAGRLRVVASPGDLRPAHCSAMGKSLLAVMPREDVDKAVTSMLGGDDELPSLAPNTIRTPDALLTELRVTAARGYAVSDEEGAMGVKALGMRVDASPSLPLAISVSFSKSQFDDTDQLKLLDALADAAARVRAMRP